MINKDIIVDTSKIKTDIIKELENLKNSCEKITYCINKIKELKCPEYLSMLEIIDRNTKEISEKSCLKITQMKKIIKDFNFLTNDIIKKSSSIEKINLSSLMSKNSI